VLSGRGEEVIGVDAGAPQDLGALREEGVEVHLQADGLLELERIRAVIKSPGVPAQAPVIAQARARGIPVLGELELAWRLLPNEFIAVTGTNGKTTTTELIGHIHREAGLPVAVAGNVGTALSSLIGELEQQTTIVCETSSFQLEDTSAFAPEAGVLLNLTPDHLNRHGTMQAYTAAKLEIFARQGAADLSVLPLRPPNDGQESNTNAWPPKGIGGQARGVLFGEGQGADLSKQDGQLWWQGRSLMPIDELRIRGEHNVENAMAAAAVCLARGVEPDAVCRGLRTFGGVAHRLEVLASRDGVLYVNDSKATNVASTLVALRAFPGAGLHLILGGQGKDQDFLPLRAAVEQSCRAVYLIGEDAPLIATALASAGVPLHRCETLERALEAASATATAGEVILLSPGCASFDQFADFEARGERFRELVSR
jgi:UDP-N-acetylmuramoylalanine--D-glutamate ligase